MNIQDKYQSIREKLKTDLHLKNVMEIPAVLKISINVGTKEAVSDKKVLEKITEQISLISGQKPVITKAKKDISSFKLRKGMPIGVMVTLRGQRMWHFLDKLIN